MATMKTLNGYGFNATELNGKTSDSYLQLGADETGSTGAAPKINADTLGGVDASNYLKKTDTASDTSKLGGKAPEYYIQPRNLLDNSDFTNPVNQRGLTTYNTKWQYTIDRWIVASVSTDGALSLDITDSGITITNTTGNSYFIQRVPKALITFGNTYTLAYQKSDGTIVVTTVASFEEIGGESYQVVYVIPSGATIVWAALYEGSYTADTLPPYVPKGYAAELAECQRYYEFVGLHKYSIGRIGEVYFGIQFTQKRISPTVIMALDTASNNITNKGELWNTNRVSAGGLLYYVNDTNVSYWYGHATVSADL